ncbi:MAG: glutathione S-transferase family protein [Reyranellaceae bacterium]
MTDTPSRLVLWGVSTSRTLRAAWALHELSLDYDLRPILPRSGETKTPEYTRLNPRQKIPLLQDGDFTIGESAAIIAYLSDTYGTDANRLVPLEAKARARWREWCFFIAMELDATSLYVMRRHGALKRIYGEAPAAMDAASAYFQGQMRHVEAALADGRPYLLGNRFTSADMLLTTCLVWAIDYKVPVPACCPDYLAGIVARPAYQAALRANLPRESEQETTRG